MAWAAPARFGGLGLLSIPAGYGGGQGTCRIDCTENGRPVRHERARTRRSQLQRLSECANHPPIHKIEAGPFPFRTTPGAHPALQYNTHTCKYTRGRPSALERMRTQAHRPAQPKPAQRAYNVQRRAHTCADGHARTNVCAHRIRTRAPPRHGTQEIHSRDRYTRPLRTLCRTPRWFRSAIACSAVLQCPQHGRVWFGGDHRMCRGLVSRRALVLRSRCRRHSACNQTSEWERLIWDESG